MTSFELYGVDDGPSCRVCGCTDEQACPGGCIWALPDLCSRCARLEQDGYDRADEDDQRVASAREEVGLDLPF